MKRRQAELSSLSPSSTSGSLDYYLKKIKRKEEQVFKLKRK
jgi:hypothetical protein